MEKLKSFLNQYFWLIFMVWLAVVFVIVFALHVARENASFDQTISNQSKEAGKAVQEANNANANTADFDIERRSEDVVREKTIAPKLESARRKSINSKTELERAKRKYNEKQNDTSDLSNSDADNCIRLKKLFANVRFEECR